MKPQCNTSADCLRELARVMDQFGLESYISAIHSKYVHLAGKEWGGPRYPAFDRPHDWKFAIAEVEGKPVFIGDELYNRNGYKFIVDQVANRRLCNSSSAGGGVIEECSWNPPKPATVMVELPYDYARNRAAQNYTPDATLVNACKTALEKLKS